MTTIPKLKDLQEETQAYRKGKPVDQREKINALLRLRDNNMDIAKTAKELGMKPAVLSRWKHDLGETVYKQDDKMVRTNLREINTLVEKTRKNIIINNNNVIERANEVQMKLLDKLETMIDGATNMFYVSQAIQILNQITTRKAEGQDDGVQSGKVTNTYTQIIENRVLNITQNAAWKERKLAQLQGLQPSPQEG